MIWQVWPPPPPPTSLMHEAHDLRLGELQDRFTREVINLKRSLELYFVLTSPYRVFLTENPDTLDFCRRKGLNRFLQEFYLLHKSLTFMFSFSTYATREWLEMA